MSYQHYPYVENQQYLAQVVDQGYSTTKNGDPVFKLFVRMVGKVTDFVDPAIAPEPVPGNPEVEVRVNLYGDEKIVGYRIQDLQNLGWAGNDLDELSSDHPAHHSFVGQKIIVTPKYGTNATPGTDRPFWNVKAMPRPGEKSARKFVNDVPADARKAKLGPLSALAERLRAGKPAAGQLVGAGAGAGDEGIPF